MENQEHKALITSANCLESLKSGKNLFPEEALMVKYISDNLMTTVARSAVLGDCVQFFSSKWYACWRCRH